MSNIDFIFENLNFLLKLEIHKLKSQLKDKKDDLRNEERNDEILGSLYKQEVINEDGNLID